MMSTRWFVSFFTGVSLVVVAAGAAFWSQLRALPLHQELDAHVRLALARFRATHHTSDILDWQRLEAAYPRALLQAQAVLPQAHRLPSKDIALLHRFATSCRASGQRPDSLHKAFVWQAFRCGLRNELPKQFFQTPPFLHPFGNSYAYRAVRSGHRPFQKRSWKRRHLRYLHIAELAELSLAKRRLSRYAGLLGGVSLTALQDLRRGLSIVVTGRFAFLLSGLRGRTRLPRFRVYPVADFLRAMKTAGLELSAQSAGVSQCQVFGSNRCWLRSRRPSLSWLYGSGTVLILGLLSLIFGLSSRIFRYAREQRDDHRRKQLMLQTLTHELRTPLTASLLSIETMRQEFDAFPDKSQLAFLRLCNDLQKLKRVARASQQYLRSHVGRQMIEHQRISISSANGFVSSIVGDFCEATESVVAVEQLETDLSLHIDPYWLSLCMTNVLDNAHAHGEVPVSLGMALDNDALVIAICDSGVGLHASLEELCEPFYKGEKSVGMGLGLGIVQQVLQDMGARLTLTCNPTTFSIHLPLGKEDEKRGQSG